MSGHRKSKSRDAILEAAAALLSRNPGASLTEVAEAAGVGRATLHRHFPSRDALVRELALDAIRLTDEATANIEREATSAVDAMRRTLEAVIPLGDRFHFLATEPTALRDPDVDAAYRRQLAELTELVDAMRREGAIGSDLPAAWVATTIDSLIYAAWTAVHEGAIARNDAATLVFRTLLHGIGPVDTPEDSPLTSSTTPQKKDRGGNP